MCFLSRDFHAPYVFTIDNGIAAALITSRWVPQRWGSFIFAVMSGEHDLWLYYLLEKVDIQWIYVHHCSSQLVYWRQAGPLKLLFSVPIDQRVTTICFARLHGCYRQGQGWADRLLILEATLINFSHNIPPNIWDTKCGGNLVGQSKTNYCRSRNKWEVRD